MIGICSILLVHWAASFAIRMIALQEIQKNKEGSLIIPFQELLTLLTFDSSDAYNTDLDRRHLDCRFYNAILFFNTILS